MLCLERPGFPHMWLILSSRQREFVCALQSSLKISAWKAQN